MAIMAAAAARTAVMPGDRLTFLGSLADLSILTSAVLAISPEGLFVYPTTDGTDTPVLAHDPWNVRLDRLA